YNLDTNALSGVEGTKNILILDAEFLMLDEAIRPVFLSSIQNRVASIAPLYLPQRTKMRRQFRRLGFDQIGFHVLDDPVAHSRGQKIDDSCVNFRRRSERP